MISPRGAELTEPTENARRTDPSMAEKGQFGISLLHIAGMLQAQRHLVNCGVPSDVIARVLSGRGRRRVFGTHLISDHCPL